jgi:hypothetical protein
VFSKFTFGARLCPQDQPQRVNGLKIRRIIGCAAAGLRPSRAPSATKARLRAEHAQLDPFALKKNIELKLKKFFPVLGILNREATMA